MSSSIRNDWEQKMGTKFISRFQLQISYSIRSARIFTKLLHPYTSCKNIRGIVMGGSEEILGHFGVLHKLAYLVQKKILKLKNLTNL